MLKPTIINKVSPNTRFALLAFVIELAFLIVFGTVVVYDPAINASSPNNLNNAQNVLQSNPDIPVYHFVKDVSVMMVVGFGFLMVVLYRYGYGALSYNLFLVAIVIQWAIIMNGSTTSGLQNVQIYVGLRVLIRALFTVCAVLISFGAVIGKLNLTQLLFMMLCEVPILVWNEYLGKHTLHVIDTGDSIFIHGFGAFFGLAVSAVQYRKHLPTDNLKASYVSDIFSMVGTLFLWIYWPSFNGGDIEGRSQGRALTNTFLALTGSVVGTFFTMSVLPQLEESHESLRSSGNHGFKFGRFNMVYIQNATIAGGVAVGSCCAMMVSPCLAIFIGFMAGFCSVIGYRFVTPFFNRWIHDTCGVHNLHGFPSFIAAIASAVTAALAYPNKYNDELYYVFPAMSPAKDMVFQLPYQTYVTETNLARSQWAQGGFQIAGWLHTFLIATVGGLVVGVIIRFVFVFETPDEEVFYDDIGYFDVAARDQAS